MLILVEKIILPKSPFFSESPERSTRYYLLLAVLFGNRLSGQFAIRTLRTTANEI